MMMFVSDDDEIYPFLSIQLSPPLSTLNHTATKQIQNEVQKRGQLIGGKYLHHKECYTHAKYINASTVRKTENKKTK